RRGLETGEQALGTGAAEDARAAFRVFPHGQDGRCDAPTVLTLAGEKLRVAESLQVEAEALVEGEGVAAALFLGICAALRRGFIVRGMESLGRVLELLPRPLFAGGEPQEEFVCFHRDALQMRRARMRYAFHTTTASSLAGSTARPLREQLRIAAHH